MEWSFIHFHLLFSYDSFFFLEINHRLMNGEVIKHKEELSLW
jgi:hypothetical protein